MLQDGLCFVLQSQLALSKWRITVHMEFSPFKRKINKVLENLKNWEI